MDGGPLSKFPSPPPPRQATPYTEEVSLCVVLARSDMYRAYGHSNEEGAIEQFFRIHPLGPCFNGTPDES